MEVWKLGLWMTSSCCTKRSCAAVPHSILRDAIGTFHTGKSANSTWGVSLPGNFLHQEKLRRCPPQTLEGRHRDFSHWVARQFLQQAKPREKVYTEIFSKPIQRVSRQLDAPSGPSTSGGSLPITSTSQWRKELGTEAPPTRLRAIHHSISLQLTMVTVQDFYKVSCMIPTPSPHPPWHATTLLWHIG